MTFERYRGLFTSMGPEGAAKVQRWCVFTLAYPVDPMGPLKDEFLFWGPSKTPKLPWGKFKVEVIFFPRGAPRGDPQGESPGGVPGGVPGAVRASHLAKKRSKDLGVFFHAAFDFHTPGP